MNVDSGYAEVNGTKLYYELAGEGEPIVLIHGNGVDTREWDEQFTIFAEHHKVLRYDARIYGKSDKPVEGVPYSHHEDLKELMNHLGLSKAHIVGHSWGSGVAVDFVLAYTEMAYSLIPVGPWVFGYVSPTAEPLSSMFQEVGALIEKNEFKAAMDVWIDHVFEGALDFKGTKRIREIGYDYSFWPFMHEDPVRYLEPSALNRLSDILHPTLIITSEFDVANCKEVAYLMDEKIPNSTLVEIQDAAHMMNVDKPAEFNKLILDFISSL
jgi:pimeloyl-ACP methyl ester carboxylesterase